jgi:hypothetical protein
MGEFVKRSEAIQNIVNVLRLTGNHYCNDGRDIQDADKILNRLEQIGMLPPSYILYSIKIKELEELELQVELMVDGSQKENN